MAISVVMPALEMAQETGKLVAWLKQDGDTVAKGDPLLEIETEKAVLEVEAAADGILAGITGEPGTDIPVGQTIAWILKPGESVPVSRPSPSPGIETATPQSAQHPESVSQRESSSGRVSPKARRMAKEAGVDLDSLKGTGEGGEILASDIQVAIDARAGSSISGPSIEHEPLSSIGRLMAERTTQSWTTVPHFFLQREVDATALNAARATHSAAVQAAGGTKLTHTDILIALIAKTLARHPRTNASWIDGGIRLNHEVNISLAMAIDDGVVAPVIHNANALGLAEITKGRVDHIERARSNRLRPADLSGGTFTISNLGMFHIDSFCGIITPPQAAILAVGQIVDRVVAHEGSIALRPMMTMTISCDHRVLDGAKAARFLHDLAEAILQPSDLTS